MAVVLSTYIAATQALLGTGSAGNLYPTNSLIAYINIARNQIASEGQCVRALPAVNGPITVINLQSAGSGYTACDVIISAPDAPPASGPFVQGLQATAVAALSAGQVASVTLINPGAGYFAPGVAFSGNGTGAAAIALVSGISQTEPGQEVYPFSALTALVASSTTGISEVLMVNSVSILWGVFRYTLMRLSFSKYQARARTYTNAGYTYLPACFAQFGQGDAGSLYTYPVPNSNYPMEVDCCCLPITLMADTDVEAIPYPWTDCVPFLAAYYALTGSQRFADADRMWKEYEKFMKRARQMSNPRSVSNWYGRS